MRNFSSERIWMLLQKNKKSKKIKDIEKIGTRARLTTGTLLNTTTDLNGPCVREYQYTGRKLLSAA